MEVVTSNNDIIVQLYLNARATDMHFTKFKSRFSLDNRNLNCVLFGHHRALPNSFGIKVCGSRQEYQIDKPKS